MKPILIDWKTGAESPSWYWQMYAYREILKEVRPVSGFSGNVDFDPESHTYSKSMIPVPSVSSVIGQVVETRFFSEKKRDFGALVHEHVGYLANRRLNFKDMSESYPEIVNPVLAAHSFFRKYDLYDRPVIIEKPIMSQMRWYAGTPDINFPGDSDYDNALVICVKLSRDGSYEVKKMKFESNFWKFKAFLTTCKERQKNTGKFKEE